MLFHFCVTLNQLCRNIVLKNLHTDIMFYKIMDMMITTVAKYVTLTITPEGGDQTG